MYRSDALHRSRLASLVQFVDRPPVSETAESGEGAAIHAPVVDNKPNGADAAASSGGGEDDPLSIALSPDWSECPSPCGHESQAESSPTPNREMSLRRRRTITSGPSSESPERPSALDTELHATLERLQAAEWHVRHRQESMGKASFRQMIAEHSAQAAARRASTRTSSVCSNNQGESAAASRRSSTVSTSASVVADLPRARESTCLGESNPPQTDQARVTDVLEPRRTSKPPASKKKRKVKRAQSGTPSFMKMAAPPLSSLLRTELGTADAPSRAGRSSRRRPK